MSVYKVTTEAVYNIKIMPVSIILPYGLPCWKNVGNDGSNEELNEFVKKSAEIRPVLISILPCTHTDDHCKTTTQ